MNFRLLSLIGFASLCAAAQAGAQETVNVESTAKTTYSVIETSHTTQAVNYQNCQGAAEIDLTGTSLMPDSDGKAKVRCNGDVNEVTVEFRNLLSPTGYGNEYLTYVLWAISPEGQAVNLGEVLVDHKNRSKLTATTNLRAFSLIVTAEPYYAVTEPSSMLVLENLIRANSNAASRAVAAKYEVIGAGGYRRTGRASEPVEMNAGLPLSFYEAQNAVRIAKSEGADQNGGYSYQHALLMLEKATDYASGKHVDKNHLDASSRAVIEAAEEARAIAAKRNSEPSLGDKPVELNGAQGISQVEVPERSLGPSQAQVLLQVPAQDPAQADGSNSRAEQAANIAAAAESETLVDSEDGRKATRTAELTQESANQIPEMVSNANAEMSAKLSLELNMTLAARGSVRGPIAGISDIEF